MYLILLICQQKRSPKAPPCLEGEVLGILDNCLIVGIIARSPSLAVLTCANHQATEVKLEFLTTCLGLEQLFLKFIAEECNCAISAADDMLQALAGLHFARLGSTMNCGESTQSYRLKILVTVVVLHYIKCVYVATLLQHVA